MLVKKWTQLKIQKKRKENISAYYLTNYYLSVVSASVTTYLKKREKREKLS
jgi:hypothetical protein